MWIFSWRYEAVKEDAFQEGPPAPEEAVVRELVRGKMVKGPDPRYYKGLPPFPRGHK